MKLRTLVLAAALALAGAPAAHAAAWKQITATGGGIIEQVGSVRTSDGVLHVAWRHRTGPNTEDLLHTAIGPDGRIGATSPIQSGWAGFSNPALTATPQGLRAVWGGFRTTESGEPNQDLNTAHSPDGGRSWTLQIGSIIPRGAQAYASSASAVTRPDGTTLEAWAGTLGTWVHAGLDPASPNFNYQLPLGSYGYDPGLAADSSGNVAMAWYSNAAGHLGVHAQQAGPNGAPVGAPANMPDTADTNVGMISRTPIVTRPRSGGFYVAYPTGYPTQDRIRLWKIGTSFTRLIDTTGTNSLATLAADPKGRIWVAWTEGSFGSKRVLARRSNRTVTAFGPAVTARAVKNASSVYQLDASATAGSLDLLALFGIGTDPGGATYHMRVLPALSLTARRRGSNTTFTVADAGDPVRGAKVKAGGRSGATDGKGHVTLAVKKGRATASAKGYAPATVKVK